MCVSRKSAAGNPRPILGSGQPVGQAFVTPTLDDQTPYLVCAPTMRVPLSVQFSAKAYLALRAALLCVHRHNDDDKPNIETLLYPGLGTGVRCLPVQVAAKQMRAAFENVVLGMNMRFTTMGDAYAEHVSLVSRSPFCPSRRRIFLGVPCPIPQ